MLLFLNSLKSICDKQSCDETKYENVDEGIYYFPKRRKVDSTNDLPAVASIKSAKPRPFDFRSKGKSFYLKVKSKSAGLK